jgi:SAM-dependent MidA family methyltransferase
MAADEIRERIWREGPMRVRDAMELALGAYYGRAPAIGAEGDFYTANNVSLFPDAIHRFVREAVGRLHGARIVELGGGSGALASALEGPVTVVEPSLGLAEAQRARGLHVVASLAELRPAPTLFLANEVLDALPVHRLLGTREGVREGYLVQRDGELREEPGPISEPALEKAASRLAAFLPPGCAAEVNLDAAKLLAEMAAVAPQSYALFLDYGGDPERLYGEGRVGGTLRGFRQHRVTAPFEHLGLQDITADVDFPWIEMIGAETGWHGHARAPQGEFLADLGLLDDMMGALGRGDMDAYLAAKNLIMPGGMGDRFQALLLARDAPLTPTMPGFRRRAA